MSFESDLNRFKEKFITREEIVRRVTALEMTSRIINRTPVDTGRARASWNVAAGSADLSTAPEQPGAVDTSQATTALQQTPPGETIVISNNLPYIVPLENGSSQQAPAGMVAVTVAEFGGIVRASVQKARSEEPDAG